MTMGANRKHLLAALAFTVSAPSALHADGAPSRPTPLPTPAIVGGFHELRASDPQLAAVARFVVPRLPVRHARLARIIGGESQIVAGTNYRIMLQLSDGSRWRAEVWKKLDGTMQMMRFGGVK